MGTADQWERCMGTSFPLFHVSTPPSTYTMFMYSAQQSALLHLFTIYLSTYDFT